LSSNIQITFQKQGLSTVPLRNLTWIILKVSQTNSLFKVKHDTDYVPIPRLEKRVEYIPVDRYEE